MSQRHPSANSVARTATDDVFDRVTLITFMFTLIVATAVALSYGPAAALNHIADVLAAAGTPSADANTWQGAIAY